MKKKIISDSELKLLFFLLSLVLIAAAYFLVFNKGMERAAQIEEGNAQKREEIVQLQNMAARKAQVEEETVSLNREVEEIIAKYPSDVTTEKAIVIVQEIENISGMHVASIGFLMNNIVSISDVGGQAAGTDAGAADGSNPSDGSGTAAGTDTGTAAASDGSVGYYAELTVNYSASYESFKDMITYINGLENRMTIPSVTGSYDSTTGEIAGTVTFDLYYLTNTGKEYIEPEINRVRDGVEDIFGTVSGSKGSSDAKDSSGSRGSSKKKKK